MKTIEEQDTETLKKLAREAQQMINRLIETKKKIVHEIIKRRKYENTMEYKKRNSVHREDNERK